MIDPLGILEFWFSEISPKQWWVQDVVLDQAVARRFGELHARAAACELWSWRDRPAGRLAEIIVLDQFSRNLFRDDPRAFASDPLALALAQEAVSGGHDRMLPIEQRRFVYMPFMHSESLSIHHEAVRLFSQAGLDDNLDYERRHMAIIARFGRYPHRNAALGRQSTTEELAFLKEPGSRF